MKPAKNTNNKPQNKEIEPLTKKEFKLLLHNSNDMYKLIYIIGATMGLRESEILWIDIKDINHTNQTLTYRVQKTKNDLVTEKKIPHQVYDLILKYIKQNKLNLEDPLFKIINGAYAGNRISSKTVSKRTKEKFIKLNIGKTRAIRSVKSKHNPIKSAKLHSKNFHSLRHLYGTEVFDITESMEITANTLRHARGNLETVRKHYVKLHNLEREANIQNAITEKLLFEPTSAT